jgi:hypothetical protein
MKRMLPSKTVALALTLCAASFSANAETALEVQSWCTPVVNGKLSANDMISYMENHDTGFCWGAFATIQEFSKYTWDDGTTLLRFCPPSNSSRLQYIKVFSRFVDDHPEDAHQEFARVARQALASAFRCEGH